MKEKVVIFGAGQFGRQALAEYRERTLFFVDNNAKLWGTKLEGVEIKPVDFLKTDADYTVLVASRNYELMEEQLRKLGIVDFVYFADDRRAYFSTNELIFNPYLDNQMRDLTENEKIEVDKQDINIRVINERVEELQGKDLLFDHVEIETINRCNGGCDFCPVSVRNETREFKEMSWNLFKKIIDELGEMGYKGRLACFSNNEPFLDPTILDKLRYARENVPGARMHLFTNGTLLSVKKFAEAIQYLDELIIDNYNQELHLIRPCREIALYCEEHPELKKGDYCFA